MADNRQNETTCPECGGTARRCELNTRPIVYECRNCTQLFTTRGRTKAATLRKIPQQIIQRWCQLADDLSCLALAIREAPDGTFADDERHESLIELEQTVWDAMTNSRPRLPGTLYEPLRARVGQARMRRATVLTVANLFDSGFELLYPNSTREQVIAQLSGGATA